jgi:hypothetical protein
LIDHRGRFYRTVWTSDLAEIPRNDRLYPIALLVGLALVIAMIGIIMRHRLVGALIMSAVAILLYLLLMGVWGGGTPGFMSEMEIVTRPAVSPAGMTHVPVRRQGWMGVAAWRTDPFAVPWFRAPLVLSLTDRPE